MELTPSLVTNSDRCQEGYRSGPGWLKIMKDPKKMHSINAKDGAFAQEFTDGKMGVLEYIMTPEGATCLTNMTIGVPWMSTITVAATRTDLNWDGFGKTICDVGAGLGSVMLEVKKTFPKVNVICQELEPMIPVMQQVCCTVLIIVPTRQLTKFRPLKDGRNKSRMARSN